MIGLQDAIYELNHHIQFKGAKMLTEGETVILLRQLEEMYEITDGIPLDRLEAICAAEKDGRCVVLPVKVGDLIKKDEEDYKIYHISFQMDEHREGDQQLRFYATPCDDEDSDDIHFWADEIGKTVFLKRKGEISEID